MLGRGFMVRLVGLVGRCEAVRGPRRRALGEETSGVAAGHGHEDKIRRLQRAVGRKG